MAGSLICTGSVGWMEGASNELGNRKQGGEGKEGGEWGREIKEYHSWQLLNNCVIYLCLTILPNLFLHLPYNASDWFVCLQCDNGITATGHLNFNGSRYLS